MHMHMQRRHRPSPGMGKSQPRPIPAWNGSGGVERGDVRADDRLSKRMALAIRYGKSFRRYHGAVPVAALSRELDEPSDRILLVAASSRDAGGMFRLAVDSSGAVRSVPKEDRVQPSRARPGDYGRDSPGCQRRSSFTAGPTPGPRGDERRRCPWRCPSCGGPRLEGNASCLPCQQTAEDAEWYPVSGFRWQERHYRQ